MSTTDQVRRELLDALAELARLRPQWRVGQTLANVAVAAGNLDANAVWDLEDEAALAAAKTLIQQYSPMPPVSLESLNATNTFSQPEVK